MPHELKPEDQFEVAYSVYIQRGDIPVFAIYFSGALIETINIRIGDDIRIDYRDPKQWILYGAPGGDYSKAKGSVLETRTLKLSQSPAPAKNPNNTHFWETVGRIQFTVPKDMNFEHTKLSRLRVLDWEEGRVTFEAPEQKSLEQQAQESIVYRRDEMLINEAYRRMKQNV